MDFFGPGVAPVYLPFSVPCKLFSSMLCCPPLPTPHTSVLPVSVILHFLTACTHKADVDFISRIKVNVSLSAVSHFFNSQLDK